LQKPFRMRELQQALAGLQDAPAAPGGLIS
jgi:hypothetical protein